LDAVFNDVVNLTVGQKLCLLGPQIWNAWVKARADIRSAAAVNAVAVRAASEKELAAFIQDFRRRRHRVLGATLSARDGDVTNGAGDRGFKVRRFRTRTEAALNDETQT
jgi:hypothetical protein